MKRWIYLDEWWPVVTLRDTDDDTDYEFKVELPEELVSRYETYLRGFDEVQNELNALYYKVKKDAQA